jgi:uncharacterized protein YdbL (DUF1318 family)
MRARELKFWTIGLAVLIVMGCVTINLYFPEGEVQDLAQKIEEQVQEKANMEGTEDDGTTEPEGDQPAQQEQSGQLGSVGLFDSLLGITPVYAQAVPEPEVTNPAIRKIIDSRAGRLPEINKYKAQGVIGENNQGLLEARDLEALTDLRARADVQKLVRAENADREQLYKEIAAVKNIELSQLPKIRETYAGTLRNNARAGDWIQTPDGTWKQKGS